MSKNADKIKPIYDLCVEFYKYETFMNNKHLEKIKGYLFDKESIDKIKQLICYEKVKSDIKDKKPYQSIKIIIKKHCENKIIKNVLPKQFKNSQELIDELNKNKKFYLINNELTSKISKANNIMKYSIEYITKEENIIIIINNKEKLFFKINECIIDKLNLIQNNEKKENNQSEKKNKFKEDLEILIRLYYYYKKLKEKENDSFKELKYENKEIVYLINNSWLEKYKLYFAYNELENYLNKTQIIQNYDFISNDLIEKHISNLSDDYINKIKDFDKNEKFIYEYDKLAAKEIKKEIRYLINFQIINAKIFELFLLKLKYILTDTIKKSDLYFIGNKKLLLKHEVPNDIDQIGFINNDNNIFISEYLLRNDNENEKMSYQILNNFFLNNFINFIIKKEKNNTEIFTNDSRIG